MEYCVTRRSRRHKDGQYIQRIAVRVGDGQIDDPFEIVVRPIGYKKRKKKVRFEKKNCSHPRIATVLREQWALPLDVIFVRAGPMVATTFCTAPTRGMVV